MSKETIEIILAITQILGVVALIIYVVKTWHIATALEHQPTFPKRRFRK
jgi:hypothetical protein